MPTLTVVVEQLLAPVPGGTGRVTAELTAALAQGAPAGWRVRTVCAWHRSLDAAVVVGPLGPIRPSRLPIGRRVLTALWERGLPPLLRGTAVLAPTPLFPPAIPAVLQHLRRKQQRIVIVHDAVPYTHPETLTPRGVHWHRRMIGRAAEGVDAIVVPSRAVAEALAAQLKIGVQVIPVGWGVGAAFSVPSDAAARVRRLGLAQPYLLFVGTVEPRKGLDLLVAALALVTDGTAPLLAVAGPPGWGGVDVQAMVTAAGLSAQRVRRLGSLNDADLTAVMAGAQALVAPSRSEGFGLPVLEAMSLGVPVIVSDVPALTELVGTAGMVVPVDDAGALARAIVSVGDESKSEHYRRAGSVRAAQYSWQRAASMVWQLIISTHP
ncbi:MAG: glycosyltransferase family 4 protein [Actinomycetota bacterium]|nr:glycosyltransferase family 4 protein [Actinomycetota bacterium]